MSNEMDGSFNGAYGSASIRPRLLFFGLAKPWQPHGSLRPESHPREYNSPLLQTDSAESGWKRFPLGQIVATPGALEAISKAGQTPLEFVNRHVAGDWGELDEHDRSENERSIEEGYRLLSAYDLSSGELIWIITEADRSATTILLPEEY